MTEIGLLAQGRNVIWVQDASELDEGDWVLYESLKNDSTFKPPVSMRVRPAHLDPLFFCLLTLSPAGQRRLCDCHLSDSFSHGDCPRRMYTVCAGS